MLVVGYPPFQDSLSITTNKLKWPHSKVIDLSEHCKEFIEKLLNKNPKERYSSLDALKDPWIDQVNEIASNKEFGQTYQNNIEKFDEGMIAHLFNFIIILLIVYYVLLYVR